jgi:hypothetical protein
MVWVLALLTSVHVLAGVFWAGSTFALARTRGAMGDQLAFPQAGAATLAILTGATLWLWLHCASFERSEQVLGFGAACAIIALLIQLSGLPAARRIRSATAAELDRLRGALALRQRPAAGLLAIAVVCMVVPKYA